MNVVIIQARAGSTRLPGKVLQDLRGTPVLGWSIARAKAIGDIDTVWCAVPEGADNDPVAALALRFGAKVARGPEHDVLTRYLIAARAANASVVMRITSDCPLIDPQVSGSVLSAFFETGADYASNVAPRTWPRGLDTEVFSRDVLETMAAAATEAYDREHVTPWLRNSPDVVCHNVALADDRYASWRWTLDYEQDLMFMRAIADRIPPLPDIVLFEEIRDIIVANPEIAALNAHLT